MKTRWGEGAQDNVTCFPRKRRSNTDLTASHPPVSPLCPVYRLVGGLGYVAFETPQGTLRFSLQQPTVKSCDPLKSDACKDDFAPLTTLSYCNQSSGGGGGGGGNSSNGSVVPPRQFAKMPCTYWDSIQNAIVGQVRAGCVLAVDWRQGRSVLGKEDRGVGGLMLRGAAGWCMVSAVAAAAVALAICGKG